MSDRDALLAAITAEPDEDTPRLMFADWLQENGEADRGEFVRLQVEAGAAEPFSPQAREYEAAAQKLLTRHEIAWTAHISERVTGCRFARGFVEHVAVNAATAARDFAALFAAEPIRSLLVERFTYTTPPAPVGALFNLPQMARVERLDFSQLGLPADYFDTFAAAHARFGRLTDISLRNSPVPVAWLGKLLAGPELPALAGLDLADVSHLARVLAAEMPGASHRRFARLDLSYIASFNSDWMQKVLGSRCLREVEELRLAWRGASGAGPLSHVNPGWTIQWDHLRLLDLDGQGVGNEGVSDMVKELCRRPVLAPLRWLGLANNSLSADAVRALVKSDDSRLKLYHLDVRGNGLTAAHRAALAARFPDALIQS